MTNYMHRIICIVIIHYYIVFHTFLFGISYNFHISETVRILFFIKIFFFYYVRVIRHLFVRKDFCLKTKSLCKVYVYFNPKYIQIMIYSTILALLPYKDFYKNIREFIAYFFLLTRSILINKLLQNLWKQLIILI